MKLGKSVLTMTLLLGATAFPTLAHAYDYEYDIPTDSEADFSGQWVPYENACYNYTNGYPAGGDLFSYGGSQDLNGYSFYCTDGTNIFATYLIYTDSPWTQW